ncbi:uncharacterized protein LOC124945284 [Impatiens glandulifera]|uniref:uncharacterized protein LOC124945284 n=1 Tax=Impatiens glandulifera TaxID=253017 RepID=UPI001FB19E5C|nr:uncharacterized protein LOC124945284 [Impatiens glandulifera]
MELGEPEIAYSEKQEEEDDDEYFLPVSHPVEPQDEEDRPVKCPHLPHSSSTTTTIMDINHSNINEEEGAMGLRKRADILSSKADKKTHFDPPHRAVRKRHHALTNGEDLIFTPPPVQATAILQMCLNSDVEKHANIIGSK